MLKIEARGYESKLWRYASPLLALALTGITSALIFAFMGRPPLLTIYTFLVAPLLQQDGLIGARRQGGAADHDGRRPLARLPRQRLEHRHRRASSPSAPSSPAASPWPCQTPPSWVVCIPPWWLAGLRSAAWQSGGLVAWLRIRFNANEILTSLMLTYIVQYLLLYLVTGPWRDAQWASASRKPHLFSDSRQAGPRLIEDSNVHLGVLLAPARSPWRSVVDAGKIRPRLPIPRARPGAPAPLRFAGFKENRLVWVAMLISGGLAGLAGMFEVSGHARPIEHQPVARLRLRRHHRGVPWPAQSTRRHPGRPAAGADLPWRRCRADQPGPAQRRHRHLPGHPAVLPAGL